MAKTANPLSTRVMLSLYQLGLAMRFLTISTSGFEMVGSHLEGKSRDMCDEKTGEGENIKGLAACCCWKRIPWSETKSCNTERAAPDLEVKVQGILFIIDYGIAVQCFDRRRRDHS